MAVAVTSIILCLVNIILWIILALRFKKIFSTEDIIEKTRTELNKMIEDVNRNADRNITLIEDRIKQLKAVSAEADRRLAFVKSELEKKEYGKELTKKISSVTSQNIVHSNNYSKSGNAAFVEKYRKEQIQGDLFISSEKETDESDNKLNVENTDVIAARSQKIPIVTPEIFMTDIPVESKKDFNTLVKEKSQQGKSVEQIAKELSVSISEVKLSLEFS